MTALSYTLLVQADLSGTAFGSAPTFTDITRFVRLVDGIGITSWRQDALSTVAPSTMSLVLDNADVSGDPVAPAGGRFTPGGAVGPWVGKIVPGVRFRATVTPAGGSAVQLFDGFATDWDAAYNDDGSFSTCKVNCQDILGWMGNLQALRSLYVEEVLLDSPTCLFMLDDPAGSNSAANSVPGGVSATVANSKYGAGTLAFGTTTTLPGITTAMTTSSPDTGVPTAAARATYLSALVKPSTGTGFAVEAWFRTAATSPVAYMETVFSYVPHVGTSVSAIEIRTRTSTAGYTALIGGSASTISVDSSTVVADGKWHHVVLVLEADQKTMHVYLDGVLDLTNVAGAPIGFAAGGPGFGIGAEVGTASGLANSADEPWSGDIAAFAVYPAPLTASRVTTHFLAGTTLLAGERTDTRLSRLLSYRPNLGAALDVGAGTVGQQATAGVTLQQALLDVGKAEGGVVYADGQGRITLLRRTRLRNPAAAVTLDGEADLTVDYDARVDLQQLVNDATISRAAGAAQRIADATSQSTYGVRAISDTVIVNSDIDAANVAGWTVANSKDALVRAPNLVCDLLSQSSLSKAQAILGLAPLSRVTLTNLPSTAPTTDVMVQGRTVTFSHDTFTVGLFTTRLPRPTLRLDAAADAFTKLDQGNVFAW